MKSNSGWDDDRNGTDDFLFSALPAGYRMYSGSPPYESWSYYTEGLATYFWSATQNGLSNAYYMILKVDDNVAHLEYDTKNIGLSIRCLQD